MKWNNTVEFSRQLHSSREKMKFSINDDGTTGNSCGRNLTTTSHQAQKSI